MVVKGRGGVRLFWIREQIKLNFKAVNIVLEMHS